MYVGYIKSQTSLQGMRFSVKFLYSVGLELELFVTDLRKAYFEWNM
jgi:hypothetical protein